VSNTHGQVSRGESAAILTRAAKGGIRTLDTAANYGNAEDVLAGLDTKAFRIVTKTISGTTEVVVARARQSAATLNADTLLVHAAKDLENPALWPALQTLKAEGVFARIGISTYAADDPALLAQRFRPDVIQLPFSLLDQRLLVDGTLARLEALGVEVQDRSLFLQGLLFMDRPPPKLAHIAPRLSAIRETITDSGSTPLAAALGFVLARPEITVGLVGVTTAAELQEILDAAARPLPHLDWAALALDDEVVLTPSRW
jgi:aryl-alcohol dehydrogenase-like predicted oxidoreductase